MDTGEWQPVPPLLATDDFRASAVRQQHAPAYGAQVFNLLVRNASDRAEVNDLGQYEPAALPPNEPPRLLAVHCAAGRRSEDRWRLGTHSVLAVLDHWLAAGYQAAQPPVPQLTTERLGFLAATMNDLFPPGHGPYPLLEGNTPTEIPAASWRGPALFEEVRVRRVTRWLVTQRAIRNYLSQQGHLPRSTRGVGPLITRFAVNLIALDHNPSTELAGPLQEAPVGQLPPGTPLAEGVVFVGSYRERAGESAQPLYGLDPGAFMDEFERSRLVGHGPAAADRRTTELVAKYARAMQGRLLQYDA